VATLSHVLNTALVLATLSVVVSTALVSAFRLGVLERLLHVSVRRQAHRLSDLNKAITYLKGSIEAWKDYALAYEVFCECCAEGDQVGAENACKQIQLARSSLKMLGEYDA